MTKDEPTIITANIRSLLDAILTTDDNDKYFRSGYFSNGDSFSPPKNYMYDTLFQRAQQVDTLEELSQDFSRFLNVAQQTTGLQRGIIDLKTIYDEFIKNQYLLASTYALVGQFAEMEEHLTQTSIGIKSSLFDFSPTISEEQYKTVFETALKNTSVSYFTTQTNLASANGDIPSTRRYIQLTAQKLVLEKKIIPPKIEPFAPLQNGNDLFYQFQREAAKLQHQAYKNAINQKIEQAIERALKSNNDIYCLDSFALNQKLEEIKELSLDYLNTFNTNPVNIFVDNMMLDKFNNVLNPLFEVLHECAQDKDHPLRAMYAVKSRDRTKSEGLVQKETPTTIVLSSFYSTLAAQNKIPFLIPSTFETIARRYGILS